MPAIEMISRLIMMELEAEDREDEAREAAATAAAVRAEATLAKRLLTVTSTPSVAKVRTPDGLVLGTTPTTLSRRSDLAANQATLTILPDAWMFYEQEGVSGDATGIGDIKFDLASRHASLARFAYNNNGLAYSYDEHREKFGLG